MCVAYLCQDPDNEKTFKNIKWIGCDDCQQWLHVCCVGLNSSLFHTTHYCCSGNLGLGNIDQRPWPSCKLDADDEL